jgi:hypothetical protein
MACTRLHENPKGKAGKGVLTTGSSTVARVDGEEASVRGRRSGRGGQISGYTRTQKHSELPRASFMSTKTAASGHDTS